MWPSKFELNKEYTNDQAKFHTKVPTRSLLKPSITSNWIKLGVAKCIFPREEHTNCWTSAKWSTLKTFI